MGTLNGQECLRTFDVRRLSVFKMPSFQIRKLLNHIIGQAQIRWIDIGYLIHSKPVSVQWTRCRAEAVALPSFGCVLLWTSWQRRSVHTILQQWEVLKHYFSMCHNTIHRALHSRASAHRNSDSNTPLINEVFTCATEWQQINTSLCHWLLVFVAISSRIKQSLPS